MANKYVVIVRAKETGYCRSAHVVDDLNEYLKDFRCMLRSNKDCAFNVYGDTFELVFFPLDLNKIDKDCVTVQSLPHYEEAAHV